MLVALLRKVTVALLVDLAWNGEGLHRCSKLDQLAELHRVRPFQQRLAGGLFQPGITLSG